MGAPVTLGNIVGVAEHAFLIAVVPLQRELDLNVFPGLLEVDHRRVNRRLVAVQMFDEGADTARKFEHVPLAVPLVGKLNAYPGIQKR